MKTNYTFILVGVLTLAISPSFSQNKKNKSTSKNTNETELVKTAIDKESKAFFEIDYKTWADSWSHEPYVYWSFADSTGVYYFEGWDAINKGFEEYFKNSKLSAAKMERKWLDVRLYGNAAYARFTQRVEDDLGRDEQAEIRVLEKIVGQWKIVHVGVIAKQKDRN